MGGKIYRIPGDLTQTGGCDRLVLDRKVSRLFENSIVEVLVNLSTVGIKREVWISCVCIDMSTILTAQL